MIIFTHDLFEGFFGEGKQIVAGGRYRPFTQFIFAIQKELFGFKPWIGHLTNILSYALLMVILFLTIKTLLSFPPFNKENAKLIAFFIIIILNHYILDAKSVIIQSVIACEKVAIK